MTKPIKQRGKLLDDLFAALERLASRRNVIVKYPYKISISTVCEEAQRHRSSIKRDKRFDDIRKAIVDAAEAFATPESKLRKKIESLEASRARVLDELSDKKMLLDAAAKAIFRLQCRVNDLEGELTGIKSSLHQLQEANPDIDLSRFRLDTE